MIIVCSIYLCAQKIHLRLLNPWYEAKIREFAATKLELLKLVSRLAHGKRLSDGSNEEYCYLLKASVSYRICSIACYGSKRQPYEGSTSKQNRYG